MYDSINENQCDFSGLNFNIFPSGTCLELYNEFLKLSAMLDMYNIFKPVYGPTENDMELNKDDANRTKSMLKDFPADHKLQTSKKKFSHTDYTPWVFGRKDETPPAYLGVLTSPIDYLNSDEVRTALNIPKTSPAWAECTADSTIKYTMFKKGSQWIYEELKGKYRMMHYSGNIDAAVPTQGTLGWINSLNRTVVKDWRQFSVGGQVGGWIKDFDGLTFAEVNGAGHMVPADKPEVASYLIFNWLNDIPIPAASSTLVSSEEL